MEIMLNLPENVYRNFSKLAEKEHWRVEEVIMDKLRDDFSDEAADYEETVAIWADEDVLAFSKLTLPKKNKPNV